jgi:hypothetical protein
MKFRTVKGAVVIEAFGVDDIDNGIAALGYYAPVPLRAGRVVIGADDRRYRTPALPAGVHAIGLPGHELEAPIILEAR